MHHGKRVPHISLACLGLLAAAGLLACGTATAASERSVTIHFADLDIDSASGASALYQRLAGAARVVCGDDGRSPSEQRAWQECYQQALSAAIARIDNPLLSRVKEQHGQIRTAMLTQ